jgi:hypothetical protein
MKLTKTSRYALAFFFLLVILVVAMGPLVAMRREGFNSPPELEKKERKLSGEECMNDAECVSNQCKKLTGNAAPGECA